MKRAHGLISFLVAPLLALGGLAGCASARYQLASKPTPPTPLNLAAAQPPVEAVLRAVVVQRGPGSWKHEAFWDEYQFTLKNNGTAPLTIESAAVIDFQGAAAAPADDPWALEDASRRWLKAANATDAGRTIALGAMAVGSAYATVAHSLALVSAEVYGPAVVTGFTLYALPVTAPMVAMAGTAVNEDRRQKIEREFQRRRVALPARVAPGEVVSGSLFVRVAPGPQRLELRCSADGQLHVVALNLTAALAGLHLRQPAAAPPLLVANGSSQTPTGLAQSR